MQIIKDKRIIKILKPNGTVYPIKRKELNRIRKKGDVNYSEWIEQLLPKIWITKPTLHKLAKVIQEEFPNNDIDWAATYESIEKKFRMNWKSKTGPIDA